MNIENDIEKEQGFTSIETVAFGSSYTVQAGQSVSITDCESICITEGTSETVGYTESWSFSEKGAQEPLPYKK